MDSILLIPPGASYTACSLSSAIQLGSWLNAPDGGADYGARDLIHSLFSSNALTDGGVFAARFAPPRNMSIPLIINSLGSNTASAVMLSESAIRRAAMPGAMLAIQPEGVPTAERVFFDVIDGRYEQNHNTYENRANVRKGDLKLVTQPFGYWPTEILLASAASVGFMGNLAVNGASVIGDVPPLAHVWVAPTVASQYAAGASWMPDMIAFSLGGRPSFTPLLMAASWQTLGSYIAASVVGDAFAPASQAQAFLATFSSPTWIPAVEMTHSLPTTLQPAYAGRFRAFMFAKTTPSSLPWLALCDGVAEPARFPMASSNQIASVYSVIPSANVVGSFISASPAYSLFDMGEITLPPIASGAPNWTTPLRLWLQNPSIPAGATSVFTFGGVFLLPVDGAAGVLTRGAVIPSLNTGLSAAKVIQGQLRANAGYVDSITVWDSQKPMVDGRAYFRGVTARIGASTSQLIILTGDRSVGTAQGATYPVANANFEYESVSVSYRPTFQFLHGL